MEVANNLDMSELACLWVNVSHTPLDHCQCTAFEYQIIGGGVRIDGRGLENSRKFNNWGIGIIGGLEVFENLINGAFD